MAYMNLVTPGQKSGGLLAKKEKGFDWGMFNPLEFKGLGGEREFNPKGAYNKFTDYFFGGDDDSEVRNYTQTGGDATGLEELYKQQKPSGPLQGLRGEIKGPELPSGSGEAVEMPEFAKSQMLSYKDPEISGRQEEEKRVLAQMALAQQTPSLAPQEASWLDKILGNDEDSGLALAGGSVATVEDKAAREKQFADMSKRLDLAGISEKIGTPSVAQDTGSYKKFKKWTPASGSDVPGMADDYDVSGDDDMGFATQSTAPKSGLLAQSGDSLSSGDSSGSEGMSVGKMQALLKAGQLLSGSTAEDQPAQRAQILPVMRGSTPNFASTKKPQRQYFRPRGLGQPFDYA